MAAAGVALVLVLGLGAYLLTELRPLSIGRTTRVTIELGRPACINTVVGAFGERWQITHGVLYAPALSSGPVTVRGRFHRDSRESATLVTDEGRTSTYHRLHSRFVTADCQIGAA